MKKLLMFCMAVLLVLAVTTRTQAAPTITCTEVQEVRTQLTAMDVVDAAAGQGSAGGNGGGGGGGGGAERELANASPVAGDRDHGPPQLVSGGVDGSIGNAPFLILDAEANV